MHEYDSDKLVKKLYTGQTTSQAQQFTQLKPGDTLLLFGPMGAGKTYFTTHLCKALGCLEYACSPTYTLTNHYHSPHFLVIHSDLYRIHKVDYFLLEEIYSPQALNIIEWAEKLTDEQLPQNRAHLHFKSDQTISLGHVSESLKWLLK